MKSIWIEADHVIDKFWPVLFEDCGVTNNHEFITAATNKQPEEILKAILEADQICFFSSMTSGTPSLELVGSMLNTLNKLKVQGKTFRSGAYLLDTLQCNYKWVNVNRAEIAELFEKNTILELFEAKWHRILYSAETHEFVYKLEN